MIRLTIRIVYLWRLLVTALCFATFGIGALALAVLVWPALTWLTRDPRARARRARRVIRIVLRGFVAMMRGLRGLDYSFVGRERLGRPGQLVLANHPTLIDALLLLAFVRDASCVAKPALFASPLFRGALRACGYIDSTYTLEMIDEATSRLMAGECVVMFPEATRTRPGQATTFHRGAASIALRSGTRVTPVFIHCDPPMLAKGDPWYRIPARRPRLTLRAGDDFDVAPFAGLAPPPRASHACNEALLALFAAQRPPPEA